MCLYKIYIYKSITGREININFLRVRRTRMIQNLGVLPKIWESGLVKQNIQEEKKKTVLAQHCFIPVIKPKDMLTYVNFEVDTIIMINLCLMMNFQNQKMCVSVFHMWQHLVSLIFLRHSATCG